MIGEGVPDTELVLGASEIACVRAPPILKIAATPQPNAPKLDLDNVMFFATVGANSIVAKSLHH
jgi:hypothetical protein